MKAFAALAMALLLTACSSTKPEFQDPSFPSSAATTVVLLPLADQRAANQRIETPQAMQHFAEMVGSHVFSSDDTLVGVLLDEHGFTLLDPRKPDAKNARLQPADLIYLQMALKDYDSALASTYSAACTAEIRAGDKNGTVVWRHSAASSSTYGPALFFMARDEAFNGCIRGLFRALPDK